jgi:hypothetical protein
MVGPKQAARVQHSVLFLNLSCRLAGRCLKRNERLQQSVPQTNRSQLFRSASQVNFIVASFG